MDEPRLVRERHCRRGGVDVKIYLKIEIFYFNNRQDESSKQYSVLFELCDSDAEKRMMVLLS